MNKRIKDILLVDDDAITNFLNEHLLQNMQIAEHVEVTYDGFNALHFIKKHWTQNSFSISTPDNKLILLDINMALMDGFEFLDQFIEIDRSNQVIVALLTTSGNKTDMEKANNYPVKAYIEKPLNKRKVEQLFNQLTEQACTTD